MIERKSLPFLAVDLRGGGPPVSVKGRTFSGLASTSDRDLGGDIVEPEAFRETLEKERTIPLVDSHSFQSVRDVVGKLIEWEITPTGLFTRFSIVKSGDGDEILARVKGGLVDGLSIGYRVPADGATQDGDVRRITRLELFEVSLVVNPMNPDARITDPTKTSWPVGCAQRRLLEHRTRLVRVRRLLGGTTW